MMVRYVNIANDDGTMSLQQAHANMHMQIPLYLFKVVNDANKCRLNSLDTNQLRMIVQWNILICTLINLLNYDYEAIIGYRDTFKIHVDIVYPM